MSWLPGTVLKWEDQTGNSSHIPVTFIQVFKISRALNKKVDFKGHPKGTLPTPTFQTRTNRVAYLESGADAGDWALHWGRAVVHAQAEGRRTRHRTPRHHAPACSVPHTSGESAALAASWERAEGDVSRQRTPHGFLWPARHRPPADPSPFLSTAVPGVPEALGKRVVVDLQLCNLRDRGSGTKSGPGSSSLAGGTLRSATTGHGLESRR